MVVSVTRMEHLVEERIEDLALDVCVVVTTHLIDQSFLRPTVLLRSFITQSCRSVSLRPCHCTLFVASAMVRAVEWINYFRCGSCMRQRRTRYTKLPDDIMLDDPTTPEIEFARCRACHGSGMDFDRSEPSVIRELESADTDEDAGPQAGGMNPRVSMPPRPSAETTAQAGFGVLAPTSLTALIALRKRWEAFRDLCSRLKGAAKKDPTICARKGPLGRWTYWTMRVVIRRWFAEAWDLLKLLKCDRVTEQIRDAAPKAKQKAI